MDYAGWLEAFKVNTLGPYRVSTALVAHLSRSSNPRIVTLSSQMGSLSRQSTGSYGYRSSKAAVNKVMQVLALELRDKGIIVCPVHPGWVRTEMGGGEADISVEESAQGLVSLIDRLTMEHSGRFWTWSGPLVGPLLPTYLALQPAAADVAQRVPIDTWYRFGVRTWCLSKRRLPVPRI